MRILFLYISLPHLSKSSVFNDLIKEFAKHGHKVKVATSLNSNETEGVFSEEGIDVLRFKTDQLTRNASNVQKGIAYVKYIFQSQRAIKKYFGKEKFDIIIAHSLPPELGIVVPRLKKLFKSKFYLMLCEYIWQDSVSLGFFKENSMVCKYYKWLEKRLIKAADYIGSPSQGNIDFTLHYYPWAKNHNIHVLHYSQNPIVLKNSGENIREKYGLANKFIVIYGGNMTVAQKIENVIELAANCVEYTDIVFLLLGRGPHMDKVKKEISERQLSNIILQNFLPQDDYNLLLASCDVGLISLNEKLAIPNIPSKTLSYFNLAVPVVASIDRNTDYGQYLETSKAGLWSYAGDTKVFKENILKLYHSPNLRKEMGENGHQFYMQNMLPECGYRTIINSIKTSSTELIK